MRYCIIIMFVFFIAACNHKEEIPSDIIKPQKMQLILWDYLKADAYASEIIRKDSSKNDTLENIKLQKVIFENYKITKEDFYKSYKYYCSYPKMMTTILDSMVSKQDKGKFSTEYKFN